MSASNFSRDVLEMFYGSIEGKQSLPNPISPTMGGFKIERNNFNDWMRVWKMRVTNNNKDLFKFFQKKKDSFINVCKKEVETIKSVKIQFGLNVRFYIHRNEKKKK